MIVYGSLGPSAFRAATSKANPNLMTAAYLPIISGVGTGPSAENGTVTAAAINSSVAVKYYYFGGRRVAMSRNGSFRYLHGDHLGSTIAETNTAATKTTWREYSAYGAWRAGSSQLATDRTYTGQQSDETGLMYYNARYFDPSMGHFISPDTIVPDPGNVLDYNRYMYVVGNPLKYTDPTGHVYDPEHGGGGPPLRGGHIGSSGSGGSAPKANNPGLLTRITTGFKSAGNKIQNGWNRVTGNSSTSTLAQNKADGAAWEQSVYQKLQGTGIETGQQITVKTPSGVRTRIDIVTKDSSGNIGCIECKASQTAPLTKNQRAAFPEIEASGGTIVGKGKPGFPGGTNIPPTKVDVVRPSNSNNSIWNWFKRIWGD